MHTSGKIRPAGPLCAVLPMKSGKCGLFRTEPSFRGRGLRPAGEIPRISLTDLECMCIILEECKGDVASGEIRWRVAQARSFSMLCARCVERR